MTRTRVFGLAVWLLVGTVCVFGFYIGDTARSRASVAERFDGERAAINNTGDSVTARAGSVLAYGGLSVSERIALWAFDTDGTLLGDVVEAAVLLLVALPPSAAALRAARQTRRWLAR